MTGTYERRGDADNPGAALSVNLHAPSLHALGGSGERSLFEAMGWVFPLEASSLGTVELIAVDIHPEGYWHASATECRWVRPIRCTLGAGGRTVYFEFSVPWLCDERAAATSSESPDHAIGGHRGLYLGRPLVPRLQLVARPGLRRVATARRLSWALVPDIGPTVMFTGRAQTLEIGFGRRWRPTLHRSQLSHVFDSAFAGDTRVDGLGISDQARLQALARDGGAQSRRFSPAALSAIDAELGLSGPTWWTRVLTIAEHALANRTSAPEYLVDELGDDALQYRPYGDLLRRAIARGALRGQRDFLEAELARNSSGSSDIDAALKRLVARVRSRILFEIDDTVRPGAAGGVVATADERNTLAMLESQRAITRYGPGGEHRRGANRLWLRGLHPGRRGEICPLLTPESEDLGLVRSAALQAEPSASGLDVADVTGPGDLSVSAGLIPFVNHTDPTRASIAARMLRQAVPVHGAQRPRVETVVADRVANELGVCRAPHAGKVVVIRRGTVTIEPANGGEHVTVGFGPATPSVTSADSSWRALVEVGDRVYTGDIVAAARDVVITDGTPHLAQGRDCLVAYMPWRGWNFEDAIVVSEAIAGEFTSSHHVQLREPLDLMRGELPTIVATVGSSVEEGDLIIEVTAGGRPRRTIRAAASGTVTAIDAVGEELLVELRVERRLEVGDKLTNRHGAKGVVAAIVPEQEMPRLPDDRGEGRRVEVILNPLGVIRRLNLSQLLETHATLRSQLSGSTSTEIVGRRLESLDELSDALNELGAPGGRLPLRAPDGSSIGGDVGVVVGWQQILKLDHLASNKARARFAGDRSPLSLQPAKGSTWVAGRLIGGAQRLGEMELWALQAFSADALVRDAQHRSDHVHDSVDAVAAHLRAGGLRLSWDDEGQPSIMPDLEGAGLDELPADVVQAIEVRRLTTGEGSPSRDPLHDAKHHGVDEPDVSCACGQEASPGAVCATCGTRVRSHSGPQRRTFRYCIPLAHPVPHPWSPDDPSWTLHSMPLLPPAFRPWDENRLDLGYRKLIIENLRCVRDPERGWRRLEAAVAELLGTVDALPSSETVASRLNGKRGLLRRALRGRDTDYAARGVLVPDPTRDPETIGIPGHVADLLGLDSPSNDVVLVNRQPTLLPTNLIALRPEIVEGAAFRIHPLLCERLAGDFDGDEITVHRPLDSEARREAWELFRPASSFRHIANQAPMFKHDLDVTLGLWLLGRTAGGRAMLGARLALPVDHAILTSAGPIAPSETNELVGELPERTETGRQAIEAARELFAVGVEAATGWSFSALELVGVAESIGRATPGAVERLDPQAVVDLIGSNAAGSALWEALSAGQAGKPKGIVQLLIRRGSLEGFDGLPTPLVEQSFLQGLDDGDYFATAPGGLRALSDKKLVTPLAGGLTKSLIEAAYEIVVSEEDCFSQRVGFGAILTCAANGGVCARCYEEAGGQPPALGARVGLLAAFAIGERSTQNAMKAFQGGTTLEVGGNVRRLRALFGDGSIEREGAEPTSLREILAGPISAESLIAAFGTLRDAVNDCLDDQVQGHHLEVVWRRLLAVDGSPRGGPLAAAQWPGSAVVQATTRGDLSVLLTGASSNPEQETAPSPLRLAVIQGGRP